MTPLLVRVFVGCSFKGVEQGASQRALGKGQEEDLGATTNDSRVL